MVYVGAGVGADIFPLWNKLVEDLLKEAEITLSSEQSLLSNPRKAEIVKTAEPDIYKRVVRNAFGEWQPTIERVLAPLEKFELRGLITTNYDDALYSLFRHQDFELVTIRELHIQLLANQKRYVYHIHGLIRPDDPPENDLDIVLSFDEYEYYYRTLKIIPDFIRTAYGQNPIVFIGVSFEDKDVIDVLREVVHQEHLLSQTSLHAKPPMRLALMPLDIEVYEGRKRIDFEYIQSTEERLGNIGVTAIWFQKGKNYRGLADLLDKWALEASRRKKGILEQTPVTP